MAPPWPIFTRAMENVIVRRGPGRGLQVGGSTGPGCLPEGGSLPCDRSRAWRDGSDGLTWPEGISHCAVLAVQPRGVFDRVPSEAAAYRRQTAKAYDERRLVASATELPELIGEFVEMSKEYLLQETLEPAKQLGRFGGFSIAAGVSFAVGTLLLAVAGLRWVIDALPGDPANPEPYWEGLGYIGAALGLGVAAAVIVAVGSRGTEEGS